MKALDVAVLPEVVRFDVEAPIVRPQPASRKLVFLPGFSGSLGFSLFLLHKVICGPAIPGHASERRNHRLLLNYAKPKHKQNDFYLYLVLLVSYPPTSERRKILRVFRRNS